MDGVVEFGEDRTESFGLFEAGVSQAVEAAGARHREQGVFQRLRIPANSPRVEHHPGAGVSMLFTTSTDRDRRREWRRDPG